MSPAIDTIKYAANITTRAAFSFVKINALGTISAALVTVLGMMVIVMQSFPGPGAAHVSGLAVAVMFFAARPVATILLLLIMFVTPYVFFALSNKYIIKKVGSRLIRDKGETLIYPLIDRTINSVKQKQPELMRKGADHSLLKLKLLQELKGSSESKWTRRVVAYGLKKIDIQDGDLSDPAMSFSDVIKMKITRMIQSFEEPKRKIFWMLLGFQWAVLLLIVLGLI